MTLKYSAHYRMPPQKKKTTKISIQIQLHFVSTFRCTKSMLEGHTLFNSSRIIDLQNDGVIFYCITGKVKIENSGLFPFYLVYTFSAFCKIV